MINGDTFLEECNLITGSGHRTHSTGQHLLKTTLSPTCLISQCILPTHPYMRHEFTCSGTWHHRTKLKTSRTFHFISRCLLGNKMIKLWSGHGHLCACNAFLVQRCLKVCSIIILPPLSSLHCLKNMGQRVKERQGHQ